MLAITWTIGLAFLLQVPPPETGPPGPVELKATRREIEEREAKALESLADSLAGDGMAQARSEVRRLLPRTKPRDGASRVTPLPEVVAHPARGLASVGSGNGKPTGKDTGQAWLTEVQKIRFKTASELFDLAKRAAAARPPEYSHAAVYLREVLQRQPDHSEARRLLGYVPYESGWARPFAVRKLKEGNVNHPIFGWVPADWVQPLDRGELPTYAARGQKVRWLPAQEADRLRSNWKNPWQITTEHFDIQSDVPLGEAIEFARRLEAFYDVFFTLLADLVGENLPLARRFHSPSLTAETSYRPHQVFYFATKDEFVEHLRPSTGDDIDQSLGYYYPPRPGKGNREIAYFFRDVEGQIPVTATLYHEVSHQLLFETAGPNAFTKNVGNYWVFEGLLGTYFETVTPQSDGSLEVGGLVGERLAAAQQSLADGRFLPLEQFLTLDQKAFNRADRIHANYQQAMALAVFLMQWNDGIYRDAFIDFVRDAYRGRIRRSTGRSLEDRLGEPLKVVEKQFRDFYAKAGQIR